MGQPQRVLGGEAPTVFTCGYSGHTPASLLAHLRAAGVRQVLDVRSFPRSRKPGFSKAALSRFLRDAGVEYVHLPSLGAPPSLLQEKKAGLKFADLAPTYRRHLARQGEAIDEALRLAKAKPSALLCLEKDPADCHRGILAQRFARAGFRVVHL